MPGILLFIAPIVGAEVVGRLHVAPAAVGRPTEIHWDLKERGTGKAVPALLTVLITPVEGGDRVFLVTRVSISGDFAFRFHFTDGSPHRVVALAETENAAAVREEKVIHVAAANPPQGRRLVVVFLFLGVVTLGVVAGRASRGGGAGYLQTKQGGLGQP
jgi:hypothetical protein